MPAHNSGARLTQPLGRTQVQSLPVASGVEERPGDLGAVCERVNKDVDLAEVLLNLFGARLDVVVLKASVPLVAAQHRHSKALDQHVQEGFKRLKNSQASPLLRKW